MKVELILKSVMKRENGDYVFSYFCDLCDTAFTTKRIAAADVKEATRLSIEEARRHFNRCHSCHIWVCDDHYNEAVMMCTICSPREKKRGDDSDGNL
ncbi:MAG: hypothetical protein GXY50_10820 [Syntrophomonadaceae bacterium]|nr:hypothetical protein [Syntrophomonadaceae bacterium]